MALLIHCHGGGDVKTCHGVKDPHECALLTPFFASLKIGSPPLTLCTASSFDLKQAVKGNLEDSGRKHTIGDKDSGIDPFAVAVLGDKFRIIKKEDNETGYALANKRQDFDEADTDGDNYVTDAELLQLHKDKGREDVDLISIQNDIVNRDADNDGRISFEEFIAVPDNDDDFSDGRGEAPEHKTEVDVHLITLFYSKVLRFKFNMSHNSLLDKNITFSPANFPMNSRTIGTLGTVGASMHLEFPNATNETVEMRIGPGHKDVIYIKVKEYVLGASVDKTMQKNDYIDLHPRDLCQVTCDTCPDEYIQGFTATMSADNCTAADLLAAETCDKVDNAWREHVVFKRRLHSCNHTCGAPAKQARVRRTNHAVYTVYGRFGVNSDEAAESGTALFKKTTPKTPWTVVTQASSAASDATEIITAVAVCGALLTLGIAAFFYTQAGPGATAQKYYSLNLIKT